MLTEITPIPCGYCQRAQCVCPPWMPNTGDERERAIRAVRDGWLPKLTPEAREKYSALAASSRMYRIEAEWEHGGVGFTKPFGSADEAAEYARWRHSARHGATITVIDRGPALDGELSPEYLDGVVAELGGVRLTGPARRALAGVQS